MLFSFTAFWSAYLRLTPIPQVILCAWLVLFPGRTWPLPVKLWDSTAGQCTVPRYDEHKHMFTYSAIKSAHFRPHNKHSWNSFLYLSCPLYPTQPISRLDLPSSQRMGHYLGNFSCQSRWVALINIDIGGRYFEIHACPHCRFVALVVVLLMQI